MGLVGETLVTLTMAIICYPCLVLLVILLAQLLRRKYALATGANITEHTSFFMLLVSLNVRQRLLQWTVLQLSDLCLLLVVGGDMVIERAFDIRSPEIIEKITTHLYLMTW